MAAGRWKSDRGQTGKKEVVSKSWQHELRKSQSGGLTTRLPFDRLEFAARSYCGLLKIRRAGTFARNDERAGREAAQESQKDEGGVYHQREAEDLIRMGRRYTISELGEDRFCGRSIEILMRPSST